MAKRDYQTLMLPVLQHLGGGTCKTVDLVESIAKQLGITEDEFNEVLPGSRVRRFANLIHWALAKLSGARLINRIRAGEYEISPRGKELLENPPEKLTIKSLGRFTENPVRSTDEPSTRSTGSPESRSTETVAQTTPIEKLAEGAAELENALAAEVLERVQKIRPEAFEQLVLDLLKAMGYAHPSINSAKRTGGSGDGGIDGEIRRDALGLEVVYMQAKRYSDENVVSASRVRDFFGALGHSGTDRGVFVTTGRFTPSAGEVVRNFKSKDRVVLLDGPEFVRHLIAHCVGVRTERIIEIRKIALEQSAVLNATESRLRDQG